MSDNNKDKRLHICETFDYLQSEIHLLEPKSKKQEDIVKREFHRDDDNQVDSYYIAPQFYTRNKYDRFWDYPVLFEEDGVSIWVDGTLYLRHLITSAGVGPFDVNALLSKASRLLEYKKFVESHKADYKDFSQRRPQARITYRYYVHLFDLGISAGVLNQKTGVVYDFYKWLSELKHSKIDLSRVDQVQNVWISYKKNNSRASVDSGSKGKYVQKRSQTLRTPAPSDPKRGYIREQGEDLRPLDKKELKLLIQSLESDLFNTQERLVCSVALNTGARKQSVFTLRRSSFDNCNEDTLESDGTFKISIGGTNLVSSKRNKVSYLYFPKDTVDAIVSYIESDEYKERLIKYQAKFPDLQKGDEYVFLSSQGTPRYMAHTDPYFRQYGHKIKGKLAKDIVAKLKNDESISKFPHDFTFHWLRATYAKSYYDHLLPQVNDGSILLTDVIHRIARRLGHEEISTTQLYINIFKHFDYLLDAQNRYEEEVYRGIYNYED
ncbi:site-specific integrase [Alteromonas macleodii]|uniref:site-specific integrase n=1 Tax=Alteromonas macleodii TaxID=28108 RepID=UPI000C788D6F|nr:site-specific integrase [Alteromonas macleodii]